MTKEELIAAIRSHALVGRGSCTSVDECYDDAELWDSFGPPAGNETLEAALAAAIECADLHIEGMQNARFGDDDDVEVAIGREWDGLKRAMGLL